jgi:signal peptidase II
VPNAGAESGTRDPSGLTHGGRLATAIVVVVVALDQVSKAWAVGTLSDGPISIIGSDVELHLSRNSGSAFSLFRGFTPLLAVMAVVIAFVLARAVRHAEDRVTLASLALVLGGALGNLADRAFRGPGFLSGRVVDFVKLDSWPTFNVADSAITVGAVALIVTAFLPRRHKT